MVRPATAKGGDSEKHREFSLPAEGSRMGSRPLIAMIHHNRPDLTDLAVYSLRAHTVAPYRLLLINNASADDLGCLAPDELVTNQRPRTFAHNCNLALERAQGERVVLLNNDVFLPPGWLEGLMGGLDLGHGLVGAVSNFEIPLDLELGGQRVRLGAQGDRQDIRGRWQELAQVLGNFNLAGALKPPLLKNSVAFYAVAVSRAVIGRVGLLDQRFVHGYEDLDYSLRAWLAGLSVAVSPRAYVVHFGGRSTPGAGPEELAERDRHNLAWLRERYPLPVRRRLARAWAAHGLDEEGRDIWARIDRRWEWLHSRPGAPAPAPRPHPALAAAHVGLPV